MTADEAIKAWDEYTKRMEVELHYAQREALDEMNRTLAEAVHHLWVQYRENEIKRHQAEMLTASTHAPDVSKKG